MRTTTIKVFGSTAQGAYVPREQSPHRQARHAVATTSRTKAAKLMKVQPGYVSETGNRQEIEAAQSKPGTVFWWNKAENKYQPVPEESRP